MKKLLTIAVVLALVAAGGILALRYFDRPEPSRVKAEEFKQLASQTACAEEGIKLYAINDQYVFYSRKGSCPDNYYSYRLYGATPDQSLCNQHDSIAGPDTKCLDESKRSLFETMVNNQDKADLGLGSAYRVQQLKY